LTSARTATRAFDLQLAIAVGHQISRTFLNKGLKEPVDRRAKRATLAA
jgi:hypothetical protein